MKRRICLCFTLFLALLSLSTSAFAEIKYKWGSYLRVRHEYWQNWKDADNDQKDNRNFFRVKSSLWGQADYADSLSLYAKLTNEFKAYPYFGGTTGSVPDKTAGKKGYHFDINEIVFDNLYLDVKNCMGFPVDLRLGRQDFLGMYGEGFLIADGTPQDGSRTFYFNAAKASWRADEKNTLDAIYINDPRDEEFLPVINRRRLVNQADRRLDRVPQALNTSDEQAGVLYWKNKTLKDLLFESYYIFKVEAEEGGAGAQAKESNINTFGHFAKYTLGSWALRGQFASQFGNYGDDDREGRGGYVFVDKAFKDKLWSPEVSTGYAYLSGDKNKTTKNEGWDPLFSRYPWYSELYTLSMGSETSISGYWTNLQMYRTQFTLKPTQKTKLTFWYNFMRANAQVAPSAIFSGTGKTRGHLLQSRIDYTFNKYVSTYFLAEYLIPGNFYKDKDPAIFLRTELQVKF